MSGRTSPPSTSAALTPSAPSTHQSAKHARRRRTLMCLAISFSCENCSNATLAWLSASFCARSVATRGQLWRKNWRRRALNAPSCPRARPLPAPRALDEGVKQEAEHHWSKRRTVRLHLLAVLARHGRLVSGSSSSSNNHNYCSQSLRPMPSSLARSPSRAMATSSFGSRRAALNRVVSCPSIHSQFKIDLKAVSIHWSIHGELAKNDGELA